jgi:hypothetical protein
VRATVGRGDIVPARAKLPKQLVVVDVAWPEHVGIEAPIAAGVDWHRGVLGRTDGFRPCSGSPSCGRTNLCKERGLVGRDLRVASLLCV